MKNFENIANDLFNKIRGRFPNVTIGDEEGNVTNVPKDARYFDFSFTNEGVDLGQVSVSINEDDGLVVVVGKDITEYQTEDVQDRWYNFLKELRIFAKKRLMMFDVRDINKSNLNKKDYKFLATNSAGENTMKESKMYGTNRTSYQRIGNARLAVKHTQPINLESISGRTQKIGAIYIESPEGERFKYPFKHLSGARAMARHVSEGGNAYDDFGKHITGLSEEISKLRKFTQYIGRSAVMAEGLKDYTDIVKERVATVKKEIQNLQKESYYKETVTNFTVPVVEDVPNDVSENWIDQLTIKQFNEELKDVFPYIYKLVGEATKAKELGPDELDESGLQYYTGVKKHGKEYMQKAAQAGREGASQEELGRLKDKYSKAEKKTKEEFELDEISGAARAAVALSAARRLDRRSDRRTSADNKEPEADVIKPSPKKDKGYSPMSGRVPRPHTTREEFELEQAFEGTMGQFSDHVCEDCGNPSWRTLSEEKQKGVDGKVCWKGYKRMGTKMKGGKRVDNCVKVSEAASAPSIDNIRTVMQINGAQAKRWDSTIKIPGMKWSLDNQAYIKIGQMIQSGKDASSLIQQEIQKIQKLANFIKQNSVDPRNQVHKAIMSLLQQPSILNSLEQMVRMLSQSGSASEAENKIGEAYINTNKDALSILANLRKIGKSIELGQGSYEGNLAGEYVSDVWDVYTFIEAKTKGFQGVDKNAMSAIKEMMELRKVAKGMEREPGSSSNAQFANQIVNTLYPVMQYLDSIRDEADDTMDVKITPQGMSKADTKPKERKTPLGEFILSYFDRHTGQFPKGETAVLTMIEKDYGEEFIEPAKAFIEQINNKVAEVMGFREPEFQEADHEFNRVQELAGLR